MVQETVTVSTSAALLGPDILTAFITITLAVLLFLLSSRLIIPLIARLSVGIIFTVVFHFFGGLIFVLLGFTFAIFYYLIILWTVMYILSGSRLVIEYVTEPIPGEEATNERRRSIERRGRSRVRKSRR